MAEWGWILGAFLAGAQLGVWLQAKWFKYHMRRVAETGGGVDFGDVRYAVKEACDDR